MNRKITIEKKPFKDVDIPEFLKERIKGLFKMSVFLIYYPSFHCGRRDANQSGGICSNNIQPVIILNEDGKIAVQTVKEGCKIHGISAPIDLFRGDLEMIIERMSNADIRKKFLELTKNMKDKPKDERNSSKNKSRPRNDFSDQFTARKADLFENDRFPSGRMGTLDAMNYRQPVQKRPEEPESEPEDLIDEISAELEEVRERLEAPPEKLKPERHEQTETGPEESDELLLEELDGVTEQILHEEAGPPDVIPKPTSENNVSARGVAVPDVETPIVKVPPVQIVAEQELVSPPVNLDNPPIKNRNDRKEEDDMKMKRDRRDILVRQKEGLGKLWDWMKAAETGTSSGSIPRDLYFELYKLFKVTAAALVKKFFNQDPEDFGFRVNDKTTTLMAEFKKSNVPDELVQYCLALMAEGETRKEVKDAEKEKSFPTPIEGQPRNKQVLAKVLPISGSEVALIPPSCHQKINELLTEDGSDGEDHIVVANPGLGEAIYIIARRITPGQVSDIRKVVHEEIMEPIDKVIEVLGGGSSA